MGLYEQRLAVMRERVERGDYVISFTIQRGCVSGRSVLKMSKMRFAMGDHRRLSR